MTTQCWLSPGASSHVIMCRGVEPLSPPVPGPGTRRRTESISRPDTVKYRPAIFPEYHFILGAPRPGLDILCLIQIWSKSEGPGRFLVSPLKNSPANLASRPIICISIIELYFLPCNTWIYFINNKIHNYNSNMKNWIELYLMKYIMHEAPKIKGQRTWSWPPPVSLHCTVVSASKVSKETLYPMQHVLSWS